MFKNVVMLQARMESTRLPGKVLLPINGKPMIEWQIMRIMRAKLIDRLVIVIPDTKENDRLFIHLQSLEVDVFRGSLDDVFDRFLQASKKFQSKRIIRLTADCPLIMPKMIDQMLEYFDEKEPDYLCNSLIETLPDGLDIEIFKTELLSELTTANLTKPEKEFVTLRIWQNPKLYAILNFPHIYNLGDERWTVDYPEDFSFVSDIFSYFGKQSVDIEIEDILRYLTLFPEKTNQKSKEFRNIMLKNLNLPE